MQNRFQTLTAKHRLGASELDKKVEYEDWTDNDYDDWYAQITATAYQPKKIWLEPTGTDAKVLINEGESQPTYVLRRELGSESLSDLPELTGITIEFSAIDGAIYGFDKDYTVVAPNGTLTISSDGATATWVGSLPAGMESVTFEVVANEDHDREHDEGLLATLSETGTSEQQYVVGYPGDSVPTSDPDRISNAAYASIVDGKSIDAKNDHYFLPSIHETQLLVNQTNGVLANDVIHNGGSGSSNLTAGVLTQPTNGTVVMQSDGSFTYTPTSGVVESDSFTYRATDSYGVYADATVYLGIGADLDIVDPLVAEDNELSPGGLIVLSTPDNRVAAELSYTALSTSNSEGSNPDSQYVFTFDASIIRLWSDSALTDSIESGVTTFSALTGGTVYAELISGSGLGRVALNLLQAGAPLVLAAVNLSELSGDLGLSSGKKAGEAQLIPDDKEISVGAIVLLNDDDDDAVGSNGFGKADLEDDEMNGAEAERDFHKLYLKGNPALKGKGEYVLSFKDEYIKVRTQDGKLVVSESTKFAPEATFFVYVEGIKKSETFAHERVSLKFVSKDGALSQALDEVAYTVAKFNLMRQHRRPR
ncbi:MAG: Ig-like domain-containing protein [Pirellulales bacterium]